MRIDMVISFPEANCIGMDGDNSGTMRMKTDAQQVAAVFKMVLLSKQIFPVWIGSADSDPLVLPAVQLKDKGWLKVNRDMSATIELTSLPESVDEFMRLRDLHGRTMELSVDTAKARKGGK